MSRWAGAGAGAWRTLCVAAPMPLRVATTIGALVCAATAVVAWIVIPDPDTAIRVAVGVTAAGLAPLWAGWVPRLLLLQVDARDGRVPGVAAAVRRTLVLTVPLTVLLPAAVLVIAGADAALAVPALVAASAAAVLLATLPAWVWLGACFLPLAAMLVYGIAARLPVPPGLRADASWLFQPPWLAALAAALVVLAAGRWNAIVSGRTRSGGGPWSAPAVLANRTGTWGAAWMVDSGAQLPEWFWPAGQTVKGNPTDPARQIRVLLGTPFAPLTRRQWLFQWGVAAVALAVVALNLVPAGQGASTGVLSSFLKGFVEGGVAGGVLGGGAVLIGMFGTRLDKMVRRPSGELPELALLPGMGGARATGHLLRAVFGMPAKSLLGGSVILLALLAAAGVDAPGLAWSMVACAGIGLLTAQVCLRPLAGLRMLRWWGYLHVGLGLLLLVATMGLAINGQGSAPQAATVLAVLWAAVVLASSLQIAHAWRRIKARPHPFVQG